MKLCDCSINPGCLCSCDVGPIKPPVSKATHRITDQEEHEQQAPIYGTNMRIGDVPVGPGAAWIRDAKNAEGKPRAFQVIQGFALALQAVAEVSTFGYHKHTAPAREKLIKDEGATPEQAAAAIPYNNWQNGSVETYDDALLRHILARGCGETHASDSKLRHRAHEAWNALAALTLEIMNDSVS